MSDIPFHPLADIFPMLDPKGLSELADDIAAHGQRDRIILLDEMILDGRNRYMACLMAGVEPRFEEFPDSGDPLVAVISANLRRRHLSDDQRALVAAKIATLKQGARTDLSPIGGMSQSHAADALNVSRRKVERIVKVRTKGVPELIAALERGEVSASAASEVSSLPVSRQRKIVAAGPTAVVRFAATIRDNRSAAAKLADKYIAPLSAQPAPRHQEAPGAGEPLHNLKDLKAEKIASWVNSVTLREDRYSVWNELAGALRLLRASWAAERAS